MSNFSNAQYKLAVLQKQEKAVKYDKKKIQDALSADDKTQMESTHVYMDGKYGAYILDWGNGMYGYNVQFGFNYELLDKDSLTHNLNLMLAKLEGYALGFEKQNICEKSQSNMVSVNITNTNELNATITFEVVREQVEGMTSLTDEETSEILERINVLEKIINSTDKKKTKWEKVKPILVWLADKSFDVAMTILPLIFKVQQ